MNVLILSLIPVSAQSNYDISYSDPSGDVQVMDDDGEWLEVPGHMDIDITRISSSKPTLKQNIELELTVLGTIQNTEEIGYMFYIMDGEEVIYMITYRNGNCTGLNYVGESYEEDILVASGAGTNTLQVLLPVKNLGYVSDFDVFGTTMEMVDEGDSFEMLMDFAPDESLPWGGDGGDGWDGWDDDWEEPIIYISRPIDGSTVYNKIQIEGIAEIYEYDIQTIEVQIDSISESGWSTTSSSDSWETWSYTWDTKTVPDGMHTINARAYDGEDYYYDSIIIYVDQKTAVSPQTTELPKLYVGDRFEYKMTFNPNYLDMSEDATASGSGSFEVIGSESVSINSMEYEVYIIKAKFNMQMTEGIYSMSNVVDTTIWLQRSDYAVIKEESYYTSSYPGEGDTSSHDITTYTPPKNQYGFPISVGKHWEVTTTVNTKETYTYEGETETDEYSYQETSEYECLRTETVKVTAGSFETFLIYYSEEPEEDWEDEEDGWDEDTDGDGWPDSEEEYYGTDPEDPSDYPEDYVVEEDYEVGYYSYSGYTIEYYSPKLGYLVKMESYDWNREVSISYELVSYNKVKSDGGAGSSGGNSIVMGSVEFPAEYLVIFILVIIIIIILVVIIRIRRRKQLDAYMAEPAVAEQATSEQVVAQPLPEQPPKQPL